MRRREFITVLGGAAASPLAVRAQQGERMRRIGVLMGLAATDPESSRRLRAFRQGLQELGWTEGRNALIDVRWEGDADRLRHYAAELIALDPDVILAIGSTTLGPLQRKQATDASNQKNAQKHCRNFVPLELACSRGNCSPIAAREEMRWPTLTTSSPSSRAGDDQGKGGTALTERP
jgi:hypothetical protein